MSLMAGHLRRLCIIEVSAIPTMPEFTSMTALAPAELQSENLVTTRRTPREMTAHRNRARAQQLLLLGPWKLMWLSLRNESELADDFTFH